MPGCGEGYEQSTLDALEAVGVGVDESLVLLEVFADDGVPVVDVGESGLVHSGSQQQVNHQSKYIPQNLSYPTQNCFLVLKEKKKGRIIIRVAFGRPEHDSIIYF